MKQAIVIIGIGEIGGVFARGLLRLGHPLYPVTRAMDLQQVAQHIPEPRLVLVAVGEADLPPLLAQLPAAWRDRLALLQNELLPRDWEPHVCAPPSVISVWFEKKPGQDAKVLLPSPAFGPQAQLLVDALGAVDIAATTVSSPADLLYELVRKNLYILTTNIAGLSCGGTVAELWHKHRPLAEAVAEEVLDIQHWLCGEALDRPRLLRGLEEGILADPQHQCMGRSAPARLQRTRHIARQAGIATPRLDAIARTLEART